MAKSYRRKINIIFILGYPIPFPCAAWRRIEYFAKFLSSNGMSIYIVGTITHTLIRSKLKLITCKKREHEDKPLNCIILNVQPYIELKLWAVRILNMLSSLFLTSVIVLLKPKIVIVSVPKIEQVYSSYIGAKIIGAKFIVDIRDLAEDYDLSSSKGLSRKFHKLLKRLNFAIYRRANTVITVTIVLAKYLASYGIKAFLAPNGADTSIFKPYQNRQEVRKTLGLDDNVKIIVVNGRLGGYYRIENFLKALAKVVNEVPHIKEKIRLLLIGGFADLNYSKTIAKMIEYLDIKELIMNVGMIKSPKRLAQILSACDIGLVPRIDDPMFDYAIPAKFYEYIACGLPVIVLARRGSELYNIVEQNKLGYLCQPTDIECIIKAIKDIVFNEEKLERLKARVLKIRKLVDRMKGAEVLYMMIKSLMR